MIAGLLATSHMCPYISSVLATMRHTNHNGLSILARTVTVSLLSVAGQLGAGYAILMLMYQHSFGRTSLHSGGCWELSAHPLARHHPPVSLATTE